MMEVLYGLYRLFTILLQFLFECLRFLGRKIAVLFLFLINLLIKILKKGIKILSGISV